MLSLTTGKLVYCDQFTIMPMPESVIKRKNALALADGRVKGKSELVRTENTYEIISDNIDELPEMIETTVNEGVHPSTTLLDANYNPELMCDEVVEEIDETRPDESYMEAIGLADDMMPPTTVRFEPKVVEMDDLMTSFRELAVTLPHTTSYGMTD